MQNKGTGGARGGCGRVGEGIEGLGLPWDGGVGQEGNKRRERPGVEGSGKGKMGRGEYGKGGGCEGGGWEGGGWEGGGWEGGG
jgi:hypothetical protein